MNLLLAIFLVALAAVCGAEKCKDKYSNCPTGLKRYCTSTAHPYVKTSWCRKTCKDCTPAPTPPPPAYVTAQPKLSRREMLKIKEICLAAHNAKRALHKDTPPMTYDMDLAKRAQTYAEYMLENKQWKHDPYRKHGYKGGVGENLFWSSSAFKSSTHGVNAWYNEIKNYNFGTGKSNGGVIGHFTQLVWDSSTILGCGVARGTGGTYLVSRYRPAGNYRGAYLKHVHELKPQPGIVSDVDAVL
ncbi:Golgi-associated plant pathogenesis-related protein 1-like [Clytia hemisphaerica]|uniref:ShKT domain-containing protein n=1 Tax=Clytia hemisphaerica TaxID=252671 RepID=A0A7M5V599_9CNID|eukprot:TCONS_00061854-protein